jgi:hypothetical protein
VRSMLLEKEPRHAALADAQLQSLDFRIPKPAADGIVAVILEIGDGINGRVGEPLRFGCHLDDTRRLCARPVHGVFTK